MEPVKAAKAFIEAELAKYGTWEEWEAAEKVSPLVGLFPSKASLASKKPPRHRH